MRFLDAVPFHIGHIVASIVLKGTTSIDFQLPMIDFHLPKCEFGIAEQLEPGSFAGFIRK